MKIMPNNCNNKLLLIGLFSFIIYADPIWAGGMGYVDRKEIGISPSLPEKPSKVRFWYSCYDIETFQLLDCGFTQKIIGLKEPVSNLENNGGHAHNYDTHPLMEPPSGPLNFENGIDTDHTPFGVAGQTLNTIAAVTHPIPYISGKIVSESTVTAPWRWSCVYNCYTYNSWKYEYTYDVGISGLEALPASGDHHVVVRGGTATHPQGTSGTPETVETLNIIAEKYFILTDGRKLSVNDISLPMGGLFDHKATWVPPHKTHRTGTDADINRAQIDCYYDKKLRKAVEYVADDEDRPYLQCEDDQFRPVPEDDSTGKYKHIDFD